MPAHRAKHDGVNLLLFRPAEIARPLPASDPRCRHLRDVLRRQAGDEFDAGLLNGPRGKGRIETMTDAALSFSFRWEAESEAVDPVTLLIGLARPQTARDILRDATTLGVAAIHFVAAERSEPSYAQSSLWRDGDWERHAIAGAEQAFATHLPVVTAGAPLAERLAALPADTVRLALDNYEADGPLAIQPLARGSAVALALGPERGWGPRDRAALRAHGFTLVHLGHRVLRLETAVVAALTLVKAGRGML